MEEDDFKKPLDEEIDEYQEVDRLDFHFDEKRQKIRPYLRKEKIPVKTTYTRSKTTPVSCPKGGHQYLVSNKHKHQAACNNCSKRYYLNAGFERVLDGQIVSRDNPPKLID